MIKKVFLFGLLCCIGQIVKADMVFNEYLLKVDFKVTHPIEYARLTDSNFEQLIVIGVNEKQQRLLAVYELIPDENKKLKLEKTHLIAIPESFLAYDIIQAPDRQKIVFQAKDMIFEFDLNLNQFTHLINIDSIYLQSKAQYLASRELVKDINNDGLDDFYIFGFKETTLYVQNKQGQFRQQVINVEPKVNLQENSATYRERTLYFADINLDGKQDIINVVDSGLNVYFQNMEGMFDATATFFSLPMSVHALDWWEIREADGEQMDQDKLAYRTINEIKDLNNDQLADIVVRYSQSEGVLDRQNNYEIYFGQSKENKLVYSSKPDSDLTGEGTTVSFKVVDVDNDKNYELMLSSLDIGVSQIIGALLSGSIEQDIYFFTMDEKQRFEKEPQVEKEVELSFSLSSGKSGQAVVQLADYNGDGLQDLMLSDGEKILRIYLGEKSQRLFERRSSKLKVKLPKDGSFVDSHDLNLDGKQDVIIRYGRQDDTVLNNQIVILFAK